MGRKYDDKLYKNAQKKLASELIALSPRVSCGEPGIFFLDAEGLGRLGWPTSFAEIYLGWLAAMVLLTAVLASLVALLPQG